MCLRRGLVPAALAPLFSPVVPNFVTITQSHVTPCHHISMAANPIIRIDNHNYRIAIHISVSIFNMNIVAINMNSVPITRYYVFGITYSVLRIRRTVINSNNCIDILPYCTIFIARCRGRGRKRNVYKKTTGCGVLL